MVSSAEILAPAKVNLSLCVTGRRADGYHLLDSFVVFAGFGDRLSCRESEAISLSITGPYAGALEGDTAENLVLRAARRLQREANVRQGAEIALEKNIPVAGGLGGGSSDAAAALLMLREFWNVSLSSEALMRIAASLGSDVPACLLRAPLVMRGVGEQLTPHALDFSFWMLLINPGVHQSTPQVFRRFLGEFSTASEYPAYPHFSAFADDMARRHNALEDAAISLSPAIRDVLAWLEAQPECRLARMSGSGATCVGLFESREEAAIAAEKLRAKHPAWWHAVSEVFHGQAQ